MSEDRTQPASNRRRQLARQQGQVAHSPELTAAAGCLAAVMLLGTLGGDLGEALANAVRTSLIPPAPLAAEADAVVARARGLCAGFVWPLGAIMFGFAFGAFAMHQLQVRGLWAPRLIVPDAARLWTFPSGQGIAVNLERTAWSTVKAVVVIAVVGLTIRAEWTEVISISGVEGHELARGVGRLVIKAAWALAAVLLVLGMVDYALRYRRYELTLRTTSEEQREDRRVMEGDPATRAQRRRVARTWRGDAPELLTGASLIVGGAAGLTLVLAGGPPPHRVTIRTVVKGSVGTRLRRCAAANQVPQVDAPQLARRLARRPSAGSPVAAEAIADLAAIWPVA
jgi:flagellar biosynthetic protein FlhB